MVRGRMLCVGAPLSLEYRALPCEYHEVTHHHTFKHKSKFHESSINSLVFEALPLVFDRVDLNILLAIANIPAAKRRKDSASNR